MSTSPTPPVVPARPPIAQESVLQKIWGWITKETKAVETGIEDFIGTKATADLEAVAKGLIQGAWGPFIASALADATDVVSGQMSVSKAISSLIAMAETEGKQLSSAAALQLIALGQNALPAQPKTITPVA
jgi:hypothetical protein